MGVTHLLGGLQVSGVPTMGMNGLPASTGNFWFVNSVFGSDGNTGAADNPFATTKQAILAASANNGDVIVWEAGHAETIIAAGGVTVNKAGLTFWGLGEGRTAATFTSTTSTAATFLISSANTVVGGNVNCICNIASQVTFFSVTAAQVSIAASMLDTSSAVGMITDVTATAAATNLNLNITHLGFTASAIGTVMISLAGVVNANVVLNAYGAWSTAVVNFITTACVNVQISGQFYNFNTSITKDVVDTVGGSTWTVTGFDGIGGVTFDGGSSKTPASSDASASIPQITSIFNMQEQGALSANAGTMVTGATIFTVAGGPILVTGLCSVCQTANNATASTLQYEAISTLGTLTGTISGASATLASAVAGTVVALQGIALATAPVIGTTGVQLGSAVPIVVQAGTINIVVGVGSTTGTWKHYIRYQPLATGVTVV